MPEYSQELTDKLDSMFGKVDEQQRPQQQARPQSAGYSKELNDTLDAKFGKVDRVAEYKKSESYRRSKVAWEKNMLLAQGYKTLSESNMPSIKAFAIEQGAPIVSKIQRLLGNEEGANRMVRFGGAVEEAQQEMEKGGFNDTIQRGLRGAAGSIFQAAMLSPAGPTGIIAGFTANQAEQAYVEGLDAGLEGEDLVQHVALQATFEAVPALIMQKLGLGGFEGVMGGAKREAVKGFKKGAVRAVKDIALELGEEGATGALQLAEGHTSGVNPNPDIGRAATDIAVQTILASGATGAKTIGQAVEAGKPDKARQQAVDIQAEAVKLRNDPNRTVSRKFLKKLGVPAKAVNSQTERRDAVLEFDAAVTRQAAAQVVAEEAPQVDDTVAQVPEIAQEAAPAQEPSIEAAPAPEATEQVAGPAGEATLRNVDVNADRVARGEQPLGPPSESQTFEELRDTGKQMIVEDANHPNRLVSELRQNSRTISSEEHSMLLAHRETQKGELNRLAVKLNAAHKGGDAIAIERAQDASDNALQDLRATETATNKAGTDVARSLNSRKLDAYANRDYSPAQVLIELGSAKGEELDAAEQVKATELANEIVESQAKLDAVNEKRDTEGGEGVIDQIIEESTKKRFKYKGTKEKAVARKRADAALKNFKALMDKKKGEREGFIGGESGAVDLEMVASSIELAKAYADLGASSFAEFFSNVRAFLGDGAELSKAVLRDAWRKAEAAGLVQKPNVDPENVRAVHRHAKKLARAVVDGGITERDEVVAAVHEELLEIMPDITLQETRDAISGYGIYSELSQDETSVILRDISGQLQQLGKLDDYANNRAAKATGVERRTQSQEERTLIKEVNEAKKQAERDGFIMVDAARHLQSAMAAAKTAVTNSIKDMEKEIATGKEIVPNKTTLAPDGELTALRERQAELRDIRREMFPKKKPTPEQQIAATIRGLDRTITQLQTSIKTGDISPKKRLTKAGNAEIDAKRSEIAALQARRAEMRLLANPKPDPEVRKTAQYKASLTKRKADLERRIAEADFSKPVKNKTKLDVEATELKFETQKLKKRLDVMEEKYRNANKTGVDKVFHYAGEVSNLGRAMKTSFDMSGLLRQGKATVTANPKLAKQATIDMFRAYWSKELAFEDATAIQQQPRYQQAVQGGVSFTDPQGKLTEQEEVFRGEWSKLIPGVAGSERAYAAGLNRLRYDHFAQLMESIEKGGWGRSEGKATDAEIKGIANVVNVFTGRGSYAGKNQSAAQFLSTYIFSPRFVVSRFQFLTGHPIWGARGRKAGKRAQMLMAREYARSMSTMAGIYSLAAIAGYFFLDEEDRPNIEMNPLSTEYLKIRWGEVILDPAAGVGQVFTIAARTLFGASKASTGEINPLRGEGVKFAGQTLSETYWRFFRTKLAPLPGAALNVVFGEDVVGNKTSFGKELLEFPVPLSFGDIGDALEAEGYALPVVLGTLAFFGDGVKRYQNADPKKFAKKITLHPKLEGINKAGDDYSYVKAVREMVAEAKDRGITLEQLLTALEDDMIDQGKKYDTIRKKKNLLIQRFEE